jgi:hypothetical protein
MSFLRHEEIFRSDIGLGNIGSGNGCRRSQCSSASMSFQSALPWQVALRQSLSPLQRLETILNNPPCRTMIFQRTVTTPLTSCLSLSVHSRGCLPTVIPKRVNGETSRLLRPQQQHWHADVVLDASGCSAEEDVFDEAVSVGAHGDQVAALLLHPLDNLGGSVAVG